MGLIQHWTIGCSVCSNWENKTGNKINCIVEFKKDGWRMLGKDWLCPDCWKISKGSIGSPVGSESGKKGKKSH